MRVYSHSITLVKILSVLGEFLELVGWLGGWVHPRALVGTYCV